MNTNRYDLILFAQAIVDRGRCNSVNAVLRDYDESNDSFYYYKSEYALFKELLKMWKAEEAEWDAMITKLENQNQAMRDQFAAPACKECGKRKQCFDCVDVDVPMQADPASDQWKPSGAEYDRAIHHNPDAKAWADMFVATFPGLADKHDLMVGWFANAMMAMHDYLKSQPASDAVQVPRELLERAAYMMEVCELDGPTMRELRALLNGSRV